MKFIILIPSKDRPDILMKTLDKHYMEQYNYIITIEYQDIEKYKNVRTKYKNIQYVNIPNDKGIGFARNTLIQSALDKGVDFVWFLDDNATFNKEKVPDFLQTFVANKNIYWMAGFQPIMDLYLNKPKQILFPAYTLADCCFLVKLHLFEKVNYDVNCKVGADLDLRIQILIKYPNEKHIFIYKNFIYRKPRHVTGGNTKYKTKEYLEQLAQYFKQKYNNDFFHLIRRKDRIIKSVRWRQLFKEVLHQEYWSIKDYV